MKGCFLRALRKQPYMRKPKLIKYTGPNNFDLLPEELIEKILYVSRSLNSLGSTCKKLAILTKRIWNLLEVETSFWKRRYLGGRLSRSINGIFVETREKERVVCLTHCRPIQQYFYVTIEGNVIGNGSVVRNLVPYDKIVKRLIVIGEFYILLFLDGELIINHCGNNILKLENIMSIQNVVDDLLVVSKDRVVSYIFLPENRIIFEEHMKINFIDFKLRDAKLHLLMENGRVLVTQVSSFEDFFQNLREEDCNENYSISFKSFEEIFQPDLFTIDSTFTENRFSYVIR